MVDWTKSMQQTFEYYTVDPGTWRDVKKLEEVTSCSITWDSSSETLGSATFDIDEEIGETYIRVYLITIQNGVREKFELGTFLVQTLPSSFDGKKHKYNCEAYTPLLELKEKYPPLGYFLPKEATNIMNSAFTSARENMRAPVIRAIDNKTLFEDYVADPSDTWLETIRNLVTKANYEMSFDSNTRLTFSPKREIESLTPIWTYDDGNSSLGSAGTSSGNNTNFNNYAIHVSSLYDDSYMIADTRGSENNLANLRKLLHYRPTREDIDISTYVIPPAYIFASSYGATTSLSYVQARKRCAAYQENGYPAGRWRLPTLGEIQFAMMLSQKGVFPRLFGSSTTTNTYYWYANSNGTYAYASADQKSTTPGNNSVYVRCVYDLWYWGDDRQSSWMTSPVWSDNL